MRRNRTSLVALLAVLAALAFAACSSDDEPSTSTSESSSSSGECEGNELKFTNNETGENFETTSTAAVSIEDGAAYTAYMADYEMDADSISMFSNPTVPADGNLVMIAMTVFNAEEVPDPIEAGTLITWTSNFDELTFTVVQTAGDGTSYGSSSGGQGSMTVTEVGDTLCFDVEYSDTQKSVVGTFESPVKDL